ncbi:DNA-directed RNA polymerase I subunit RPA49 isoform X1 [Lingula anatina]|uniref:DNA-directed RNA polymerase I subunit RPA49 isoform X1 n=1 Tax=Lingula anatina TaxID=7574 RepID=A0A1S3HS38_LINAN|nr:DNA-directed RNA polymerase I subunit RPA49 isoform X1 [Lingula anatina]|eukprot:XP_013388848.1 DNA-directed RNA polymerase I subunit RPA49 isoform X1 [Lingula anatina]
MEQHNSKVRDSGSRKTRGEKSEHKHLPWQGAKMAATIKYLPSTSKNEGILATFANGRLKGGTDNIRFGYYRGKDEADPKKSMKRTLVAETDTMEYIGQNLDIQAPRTGRMCKYLVGILDKDSGKMKVMDAQLFHMRPRFDKDETDAPDKAEDKELSFMEKNDLLTKAFGSNKKRKAMDSRIRNQIKGEALEVAVGAAVDHTLSLPTAAQVTSVPKIVDDSPSGIPPFDKDASKPEDVYKLDDIISPAEMEALHHVVKPLMNATKEQIAQWKKDEVYPGYVLQHLSVLPIQEAARSKKARLLLYMSYLIKTYMLRAPDLKRKDILPQDIPETVRRALLDKYTLKATSSDGRKTVRCMPARLKDKVVSYMLVLGLIIDEFNLELTALQKDIKMGQARIIQHSRSLGCKVTSQKATIGLQKIEQKFAVLETPLTFPDLKQRTTKKRT